ncbi:hypothetical protein VCB98_09435 [Gammaproteobacteria bacterium AB-CW1]|uniref:Glycosyl transferase family 28 C-terminal domain-containing protein n=1 Tax=Natronospira elongata TaxID=3110268 RepID=A0AAP6MLK6_9GAMM|nr:hypothetical protein [Gammaproteobacteria bacterium AB-CW1]
MSAPSPTVLFVPVSGSGGSGEYYRCLAIARALTGLCPDALVHFVVSHEARLERDPAFQYHELPDSPTRAVHETVEHIRGLSPDLVFFDSAGRMAQFRAARESGARVVWLSDRPNKRRKAFRLRMMPTLDLHLMAAPGEAEPRLGPWHRLKLRLFPHLATRFFSGIAPSVDSARRRELCEELGLPQEDYVVLAPGGGGYHYRGRPVPEIMLGAAAKVSEATGLACVMVMGPQYQGEVNDHEDHERVRVVSSLPTQDLTQLLHGARLAVIGAGSMMTAQTLSIGVPAVMVPAGGDDQPPRIAEFSRRGLASAAEMDEQAIADAAIALAQDESRRHAQQTAVRDAGMRNDVDEVAKDLLVLLRQR